MKNYSFLGNSPASEFLLPTFRNSLSVSAYEDGTDSAFRNVGNKNSDAGELSKKE